MVDNGPGGKMQETCWENRSLTERRVFVVPWAVK